MNIRLKSDSKQIRLTSREYAIKFEQVGKRGLTGDKGDKGDPATNLVQSVNAKQGAVVLTASDVGADSAGSADDALVTANSYTDSAVEPKADTAYVDSKDATKADKAGDTFSGQVKIANEAKSSALIIENDAANGTEALSNEIVFKPKGLGTTNPWGYGIISWYADDYARKDVIMQVHRALYSDSTGQNIHRHFSLYTSNEARNSTVKRMNIEYGKDVAKVDFQDSYMQIGTPGENPGLRIDSLATSEPALVLNHNGGGSLIRGHTLTTSTAPGIDMSGKYGIYYNQTGYAGYAMKLTSDGEVNTSPANGFVLIQQKTVSDENPVLQVDARGVGKALYVHNNGTSYLEVLSDGTTVAKKLTTNGIDDTLSGIVSGTNVIQTRNIYPRSNLGGSIGSSALAYSNVYSKQLDIDGTKYITGTGFPNGVVSAPVGSIYIDKAVTNGASSWIKKSGTGNTGWSVLEGNTGRRNITSLCPNVTSGNVYLMRDGNTVTFALADVVFGTNTGTTVITPTISGFSPMWSSFNGAALHGSTGIKRFQHSQGDARIYSIASGDVINGQFAWISTQSWPVELPGTT